MSLIDVRFGNFLKEKRKEKKLTQIEVAKILGMPRTTYQHYEKGETQVTLEILLLIESKLGIDMQEFFDGEKK